MLKIKQTVLQYSFDWKMSFQQNMEQFRLHITKLTSYSLTCDTNEQVLVILSNVHEASQHNYGRDFRKTLCTIRQAYKHGHVHDATSLANILRLLTSADSLGDTTEAPGPESTHAVSDSLALLLDFCQEIADECDEEALAVSGSDSDSSRNKKPRRNKY
jgi:hypothetical protein